jgi:hypothetical protein
MGMKFLRLGVAGCLLVLGPFPSLAQDAVAPKTFKEVFVAERQVNAAHLVVGVIAVGDRLENALRPRVILLRGGEGAVSRELCGEVRSLDGLYYGEMRYSDQQIAAETGPILLAYPSQKERVFEYENVDIAVRLNACGSDASLPTYRVASWRGVDGDALDGAEILLNTQSGTDVFAYLGADPLTCTQEPEGTREEIDFRCTIDSPDFNPSVPISLFVDRAGSRDPVVQFFVSK